MNFGSCFREAAPHATARKGAKAHEPYSIPQTRADDARTLACAQEAANSPLFYAFLLVPGGLQFVTADSFVACCHTHSLGAILGAMRPLTRSYPTKCAGCWVGIATVGLRPCSLVPSRLANSAEQYQGKVHAGTDLCSVPAAAANEESSHSPGPGSL